MAEEKQEVDSDHVTCGDVWSKYTLFNLYTHILVNVFFVYVNFTERQIPIWNPKLITPDFVDVIVAKYRTPYSLYKAYEACENENEKRNLIFNTVTAPEAYADVSCYSDFQKDIIEHLKKLFPDHLADDQQKKLKKISETIYKGWHGIKDT